MYYENTSHSIQLERGVADRSVSQDKQKRQAIVEAERARRMENAAQDAQDRILEESEEWDVADVEGDGGIPVAVSKTNEDQRNGAKKGAPQVNPAARSGLQKKEFPRREARHEASASSQGNDKTIDDEARDPKGSRGKCSRRSSCPLWSST